MKTIKIIILLAFTLLMLSCEKEIDIDLRSVEPRLVIEGKVPLDSIAVVKLTKTKDFGDNNNYTPIEGAIVKIADKTGYSETLVLDESGWYKAENIKGVVGQTYYLTVEYEEMEYTAESTLPPMVPIDSVTMFLFPVMDYAIPRVHFKDPIGSVNDYYRTRLHINGKHIKVQRDAVEAEQTDGIRIVSLVAPLEKELEDEEIKKGDTIHIELQSIDKGAFTFFDTLSNIDNSLTNPTSNIKGGALGYFSAYSFDKKEIIADWKD